MSVAATAPGRHSDAEDRLSPDRWGALALVLLVLSIVSLPDATRTQVSEQEDA
jgi:hypothetical protein